MVDMMVSDTVLRDEPSERTQRTVPGYVSWALSRTGIDRMSKGLVAYEVLHLAYDDYSDALSRHETALFDQLDSETSVDTREMLNDLVMSRESAARTELIERCDYEPPEESMEADLRLPSEFANALPDYAVGDHIEHAVVYAEASPWTSRLDRMNDLQDLLLWARDEGIDEPSEFVAAVVSGNSEKWDIARLHDRLSPEVERYERSDIMTADLSEWGTDIKMVPAARAEALETALANEVNTFTYTRESIRTRAALIYDDVTEDTAHGYVEFVDLDAVNENIETVNVDVTGLIDRLVDESYERASVSKVRKMENMENWEIAGFTDDPCYISGQIPVEIAEDELDELDDMRADGAGLMSGANKITADNSQKVAEWIQEKREEVEELVHA